MLRSLIGLTVFHCITAFAQHPTAKPEPDPDLLSNVNYAELVKSLDYQADAPLNVVVTKPPIALQHGLRQSIVRFDDSLGGFAEAAVIEAPSTTSLSPAVIFAWAHAGSPFADRESMFLARLGIITLKMGDSVVPRRESGPAPSVSGSHQHNIVKLRRAFDYLVSRGDVDPNRICVVGHDRSAVLAGIDRRFKCFVFTELSYSRPSDLAWMKDKELEASELARLRQVRDLIEEARPYDPIYYVGHIEAASFFQAGPGVWGTKSNRERGQSFFEAATGAKQYKWYDWVPSDWVENTPTDWGFTTTVLRDRVAFLCAHLNLARPSRQVCEEFQFQGVCDPAK